MLARERIGTLGPGALFAGRYRLSRPLGEGGMSTVWLARDLHTGGDVALKLLHRDLGADPNARRRFRTEVLAAASLHCPYVVRVTDAGVDGGVHFIVYEHVEGHELYQEVRRGPVSRMRAVRVARQVCRAVSAAHAAGVVHRDLKPENILVTHVPGLGDMIKVIDFGVARFEGERGRELGRRTEEGRLLGTPPYMSPEQLEGRYVGHAADLWALGVILFEMLTGRLPFDLLVEPETPWQACLQIRAAIAATADELTVPGATPRLEAAVRKALSPDPADRYASAEEFQRDLDLAYEELRATDIDDEVVSAVFTRDAAPALSIDPESDDASDDERPTERPAAPRGPATTPPVAALSAPLPVVSLPLAPAPTIARSPARGRGRGAVAALVVMAGLAGVAAAASRQGAPPVTALR
ncbi:MAG: protein kinase [Polyangiales bacterium]